jgi:hypothetical protein
MKFPLSVQMLLEGIYTTMGITQRYCFLKINKADN